MLISNDSLGGGGSISPTVRDVAIGGLSRLVDGVLAKKFPLGSFNETQTTTTTGKNAPAGAPQATANIRTSLAGFFTSPLILGAAAIGVTLLLVYAVAKRK
jgi:hypothetical protein